MTYRELASLFMAPFGLTVLGGETVPVSSHSCRFQVQPRSPPPTPFPFCKISESSAAGARPEPKTSTARSEMEWKQPARGSKSQFSCARQTLFPDVFSSPFAAENASAATSVAVFVSPSTAFETALG